MAWSFDGVNDYVTMADNAALTLPDGDWTRTILFKLAAVSDPGPEHYLIHHRASAAAWFLLGVYPQDSDLDSLFMGLTGDDYIPAAEEANWTPNTNWNHLLVERDGDNFNLYLNGTLIASETYAGQGAINPAGLLYFGSNVGGSAVFFKGDEAEFAQWNRKLSDPEKTLLWNGTNGVPADAIASPVVYAPMRDYSEKIVGLSVTNNGTSLSTHPPIAYPVDSAEHGHTADKAPAVVEPDSCTHGHSAEQSEAAEGAVTVAPATHAHTADRAPAIAAVSSCTHAHATDKARLVAGVESTEHGHTADSAPAPIQPAEALHTHTADKAAVTPAVDSTEHGHTAGEPNTVFGHAAAHGHTADKAPAIAAVASCSHGHTAGEAETDVITPASALHGHTADKAPAIAAVESCTHGHSAGKAAVFVDVEDSVHLHTVDEAAFAGPAPVQSCTHAHLARQADIIGLLKFATEEVTARDVLPYPVTLVEIAKNPAALDTSNPRQGKYRGVVLAHPEISEEASESTFGIRTKRDVSLELSNAKGIFKVDGGTEYRGWTAQIWRLSGGVKELRYRGRLAGLSIGQTVGLRLKDEIRAALHDRVPHRFVTTDTFPKARDAGKTISIASGRVPRIPCPNIEWDDAERIYRYALGEGEGYGGENWQDVTRAYRGDVAFKHLTGTVAGATSTTLTLQSADARPVGFLRWFWAEITSGTGAGQIRPVSAHTVENQVQVSPAWSVTPNGSSQYRLREWRFYDGGQASPYPGVAFLEFRKQILDGSSAAPVYADGEALPGETNFVRMIQSLLSNPVWGKGLQVAEGAFDRAAELPEMDALLCEGWRSEPEELVDILGDLMKARGIWLYS